jgi:predicted nucleotidyltransferase
MKKRYNNPDEFLVLNALRFFIENPYEEIYLREFSRKTEISINSVQRFLGLFLKQNFIKEFKRGNLRYFKANLDSVVFRHIKIAFSLKKIEDSGLINALREISSHLVLFGSVAEGTDDYKSDMDLVCITINKKRAREIITEIQDKLFKEINCHLFSWVEWKEQIKLNKAFYFEIITKGINLIGGKPIAE